MSHPIQQVTMQLGTVELAHPMIIRLVRLPLSNVYLYSSLDQIASAALDVPGLLIRALNAHILTRAADDAYGNRLTLHATNYLDFPSIFVSLALSVWCLD
jgi:hypothetical protein